MIFTVENKQKYMSATPKLMLSLPAAESREIPPFWHFSAFILSSGTQSICTGIFRYSQKLLYFIKEQQNAISSIKPIALIIYPARPIFDIPYLISTTCLPSGRVRTTRFSLLRQLAASPSIFIVLLGVWVTEIIISFCSSVSYAKFTPL